MNRLTHIRICTRWGVSSNKGSPPFRNHSSSSTLRSHLQSKMERWDPDLQCTFLYSFASLEYTLTRQLALIRLLFVRYPASRSTPSTLSTNLFFNSLPISTLNFLERSRSTSKRREEKRAFMKVLLVCWIGSQKACGRGRSYRVCSKRWADRPSLNMTKVLSCLQMKDPHVLPLILNNIFAMSTSLPPSPFALQVLPSLQALFAVKEPPQNIMAVLTCCMRSAITQSFGSTTRCLCTTRKIRSTRG